jgi:hypothetical protein
MPSQRAHTSPGDKARMTDPDGHQPPRGPYVSKHFSEAGTLLFVTNGDSVSESAARHLDTMLSAAFGCLGIWQLHHVK